MPKKTYTLTENEAKLYDAMRATFELLKKTDFACPHNGHGTDFHCCDECSNEECPVFKSVKLIQAVNADPETI